MPVDIDFSLALNDRTGKLFLGRDIITALGDQVANVRYGRFNRFPSSDMMRRVVGRLTHDETRARVLRRKAAALLPRTRDRHSTLHLDPLSVVRHRLEPRDIVLCHDVGPISHPPYFAPGVQQLYSRAYGEMLAAKPNMVFVSKTSQREFHALYGTDFPSSSVIYIPTRPGIGTGDERKPEGVDGPFLLTVGSIGDRKNQRRCIEAFAQSGLAAEGWRYVVIGGKEPGAADAIEAGARTPGVILPGYCDDAELRWLYRNAAGFVLMSLLEGFGMPVIEAAAYGLPCLVSESGILTEIGGPATLQADPLDTGSIAAGMQQLAAMTPGERADRLATTEKHLRLFERETILDEWRGLIAQIAGGQQ
jgi:glycosyltransferase involved in cell wall biosynthesis